jgi:GT2 family glycosyltransferase
MDINSKTYAIEAGKNAVLESIRRSGYDAIVESSRAFPTIYRIKYKLKETPKVSIIIPNKDHLEDLRTCIESIIATSTYKNYEIVIVDNGSSDEELLEYYNKITNTYGVKICHLDIEFNYSKLNNFAIQYADGDYYILLNNDIEIITPEWIEEMLMYAQRDDVGAVGAMLYYPDDTIQHAGVIMRLGAQRIAGHAFHKCHREDVGYMGRLCYSQNVSAVTAACMMIKASVFEEINGFDEGLAVAYNDVDLCAKIRKAGYLIVWTPYAEAYHYESKSRGYEDASEEKRARFEKEVNYFKKKWSSLLENSDPYYNPNFTLDSSDFAIE